jgi:hypothetical protein
VKKQLGARGLSDDFMQDLLQKGLPLYPLLQRVKGDKTLELEIRQQYLNVYYRGGSILRVAKPKKGAGYAVDFNPNYAHGPEPVTLTLPDAPRVESDEGMKEWIDQIPKLKDAMDHWFAAHRKEERAAQQIVVHENNAGPWAGGNDYFIVDIEYDNHMGARFDLVALQWKSEAAARKLQKGYLPRLTVIEMKTGDGALKNKAGLLEHYRQWEEFLDDDTKLGPFKQEMLKVFKQKRELGLIPALAKNHNEVNRIEAEVDVIFLLANHDPASGKLREAVDAILDKQKNRLPKFKIYFATSTFMGYGLYSHSILPLEAFRMRLGQFE